MNNFIVKPNKSVKEIIESNSRPKCTIQDSSALSGLRSDPFRAGQVKEFSHCFPCAGSGFQSQVIGGVIEMVTCGKCNGARVS